MSVIDPVFAKSQLLMLLSDRYQHPNGQVTASCFDEGLLVLLSHTGVSECVESNVPLDT